MISEVEAGSKEVKKGTETTISCVVSGLDDPATVTWVISTGAAVSGTDFTPNEGVLSDGIQTSTLLVKAAQVTVDTAYTCRVTPGTHSASTPSDTAVHLDVFGKFYDRTIRLWYQLHKAISFNS
jgi:hypothetical protein